MGRTCFFSLLAAMLGVAAPALAKDAPEQCKAGQSDRLETPAPVSLLPRLGITFGIDPRVLRGTSYVRCMKGRFMACMVGANLDCGRADVSRRSVGADAFCHDTPGAAAVPMAATGHGTVFAWRCDGTHAVAGKRLQKVDALGFIQGNWRAVR